MGQRCCVREATPDEVAHFMKATNNHFSREDIARMYNMFHKAAPSGEMDVHGFTRYLDIVSSQDATVRGKHEKMDAQQSHQQLFRGYDRNGDGHIVFMEFLEYQEAMLYDSDKLLDIIFSIFDADGSGAIDRSEMLQIITNSTIALAGDSADMERDEIREVIETEIDKLWQFLDVNGDGEVSKEELRQASEILPELLTHLKNLV